MGVAHVVDAEDEAVLVLGDGIANVLEELFLVLAGLLVHLRHVDDLGASGLGHLDGFATGGRILVSISVFDECDTAKRPVSIGFPARDEEERSSIGDNGAGGEELNGVARGGKGGKDEVAVERLCRYTRLD